MKIPNEHISDEILNAYIDGELGLEDTARIEAAMVGDEILSKRVNDLRRISALVRVAFQDNVPSFKEVPTRIRKSPMDVVWRVAATVAFVSVGALIGLHLYDHHRAKQGIQAAVAAYHSPIQGQGQEAAAETFKIRFHVGRADAELLNHVLGETDRLLSYATDSNGPVSVRVIASHGGLSLFNSASEQNARRVRDIKQRYQNQVDFIGCGETMQQWSTQNPEKKSDLLPEMLMVDSGVLELLRLQKRGWTLLSI